MTPERKAEIEAELDAILGPLPRPKPKVKVVANEGRVVRDAEVVVSPRDPNAQSGRARIVHVRADTVTINMAAAERQYWDNLRSPERDRHQRSQLDPFRYGHWGRFDA